MQAMQWTTRVRSKSSGDLRLGTFPNWPPDLVHNASRPSIRRSFSCAGLESEAKRWNTYASTCSTMTDKDTCFGTPSDSSTPSSHVTIRDGNNESHKERTTILAAPLLIELGKEGWCKSEVIDSSDRMLHMLISVATLPVSPPSLYVHVEGQNLGRHGSVSILLLYAQPTKTLYLIDVLSLPRSAWSARPESHRLSLQDIFEASTIPKVFFDARSPSDALFQHHGIRLQGVSEVQLMEFQVRRGIQRHLYGLSRCIQQDATLSPEEKGVWAQAKCEGQARFVPAYGGTGSALDARPLSWELRAYSAAQIAYLPYLWESYRRQQGPGAVRAVTGSTVERIRATQSKRYDGQGHHMAMGPRLCQRPQNNRVR